jgi:nucleoid DNA-binding protein
MIPKKPKVIIKQLSEEIDVSEDTIDDIVEAYYKEVRRTLSGMEHIKVKLIGIGDFMMRKTIVSSSIKKYKERFVRSKTDTFQNYHDKKGIEEKIKKLLKAEELIEEFIKTRNKFRDERKVRRNMEEQSSNNGGDQEQVDS